MSRSVPEWIGKTDDSPIPPRVRLRVFDAHEGICFLSHVKIRSGMKWEIHHIKALIRGGEHRESNLAPVLAYEHKEQTKMDKAFKKTVNKKRLKNLGVTKPKQTIRQRKALKAIAEKGTSHHAYLERMERKGKPVPQRRMK